MRKIKITENIYNQRIDKFLLRYFNNSSKNFIYKMIRKNNIKLNDKKIKGNEILKINDIVNIYLSEETIGKFRQKKILNNNNSNLDIIYEDDNILLVNKPKGVLSHSNSKNTQDTIIDRILSYLDKNNKLNIYEDSNFLPAICNRLDRNTTGIIICGKNLKTIQLLNIQENSTKYYLTIVKGKIKKDETLIGYHTKNKQTNKVMILDKEVKNSKKVITKYTPIKYNDKFTMLKIKLITGKSHQIRSHLKSKGYSILGDRKYGDKNINKLISNKFNIENQILHSSEIEFNFKDKSLLYLNDKKFIAKLPDEFKKLDNYLFL